MDDQALIQVMLEAHTNASGLNFDINTCHGGDTHRSYRVAINGSADEHDCLFVKVNDLAKVNVLNSEFESLQRLNNIQMSAYPKALMFKTDQHNCYLVMTYHDLVPLNENSSAQLGENLAEQHLQTAERFGWESDNYIGLSLQTNTKNKSWLDFYHQQRLAPQLMLAINNGLDSDLINQIQNIQESLESYFEGYEPVPSLLHGDLWSGNVSFERSLSKPILYDPAPYYGDREADIAMTRLFGSFPQSFYQAYQAVYPLHIDYEKRKPLYNLYHALNHFNLFGHGYTSMIRSLLSKL